ncbi:MAG: hypothetical protein ACRDY3_10985 [Acidimicrobiales bacterium]
MTEEVLDVRGWARLIRRFWRTVAILAAAGVVAAAAYVTWAVPSYQAASLVLLPTSAANGSSTAASTHSATTDARIALSAAVLVPAGREVDRSLDLNALQDRIGATSAASGVLRITARDATPEKAESLANAVADQLTTFLASNGSTTGSNVVAALHAEIHQLDAQVTDVQRQLAVARQRLASESGTRELKKTGTDLVTTLTTEESSLSLQRQAVKSQLSQAAVAQLAGNQGAEVIQRATTASAPSPTSLALPLVLGALGGLLVGSLAVLTWHRRDPRLRTRDALAEAVGAPVVASLVVPKRQEAAGWASLFMEYRPSALEQWIVRRALRELGVGDDRGTRLTVLAFAGDGPGVAQAIHVAVAMAASGSRTALSVTAEGDACTPLRSAVAKMADDPRGPRANLRLLGRADAADDLTDLIVEVVALDRQPNAGQAGRPGTSVVLSVSAGSASAEELASTAIAAADGGGRVEGVLVANPTSTDRSVGRFASSGPSRPSFSDRRAAATRSGAAGGRAR